MMILTHTDMQLQNMQGTVVLILTHIYRQLQNMQGTVVLILTHIYRQLQNMEGYGRADTNTYRQYSCMVEHPQRQYYAGKTIIVLWWPKLMACLFTAVHIILLYIPTFHVLS